MSTVKYRTSQGRNLEEPEPTSPPPGHDILGWMSEQELTWLAEQALTRNRIAEIGSWMGRSTKALCSTCPGTVYAIDDLTGVPLKRPTEPETLKEAFNKNLAQEIAQHKVIPIRRPSLQAAGLFGPGTFDMIFIDGTHEAPHPANDIVAWLPKLVRGGLLCGHDRQQDGVAEALSHLSFRWHKGPDRIWAATPTRNPKEPHLDR